MTLDYTKQEKEKFVAFIHNTFIWPASFEIEPRATIRLPDYSAANRAHATLTGLNLDGTKARKADKAERSNTLYAGHNYTATHFKAVKQH